jgi:hypothetical protein
VGGALGGGAAGLGSYMASRTAGKAITGLRGEVSAANTAHGVTRDALTDLTDEHGYLTAAHQGLRQKYTDAVGEHGVTESLLNGVQAKHTAAKQEHAKTLEELAALKRDHSNLTAHRDVLQQQYADATGNHNVSEGLLNAVQDKHLAAKQQVSGLQGDVATASRRAQDAEEKFNLTRNKGYQGNQPVDSSWEEGMFARAGVPREAIQASRVPAESGVRRVQQTTGPSLQYGSGAQPTAGATRRVDPASYPEIAQTSTGSAPTRRVDPASYSQVAQTGTPRAQRQPTVDLRASAGARTPVSVRTASLKLASLGIGGGAGIGALTIGGANALDAYRAQPEGERDWGEVGKAGLRGAIPGAILGGSVASLARNGGLAEGYATGEDAGYKAAISDKRYLRDLLASIPGR